jgi:small neutral amino acid transporter SnatA (MarC family)
MCLLVGPVFMLTLAVVCTVIAFASSVAIAKWFGASVSEAVKTMYDIVIEF